jgi:hypothetical protein
LVFYAHANLTLTPSYLMHKYFSAQLQRYRNGPLVTNILETHGTRCKELEARH